MKGLHPYAFPRNTGVFGNYEALQGELSVVPQFEIPLRRRVGSWLTIPTTVTTPTKATAKHARRTSNLRQKDQWLPILSLMIAPANVSAVIARTCIQKLAFRYFGMPAILSHYF